MEKTGNPSGSDAFEIRQADSCYAGSYFQYTIFSLEFFLVQKYLLNF